MHLQGHARDVWDLKKGCQANTVQNFDLTVTEFKQDLLVTYKFQDQLDYLWVLRKPPTMELSQYLTHFRAAHCMALELPDAPVGGGFTRNEIKHLYLLKCGKTISPQQTCAWKRKKSKTLLII